MTKLTKFALLLLLFISPLSAQTSKTVKAAGGGDFTTIAACLSAMVGGGNTCTVFVGTYNESPSVTAGTVGNYNVLTVNGTDIVSVTGTVTMNSHTKLIGNCATAGTQAVANNFGNCGFSIGRPSSPTAGDAVFIANNATDIFIIGNTLQAFDDGGALHENNGSTATFIYFGSNTIAYSCSIPASPNTCTSMHLNGNNQILEYNDISHVSDGPYLNGKWYVLRNNAEHDIQTTDCGSNSQNCHIDFMQADTSAGPSGGPIQFILLENNTMTNILSNGGSVGGSGVHEIGLFQANACGSNCGNGIVRFHLASHADGPGLFNDTNNWANLKVYNNSFVDVSRTLNGSGAEFNRYATGINSAEVNSLYYFTVALTNYNAYGCEATACPTFTFGHSLAFCTNGQTCTIHSHTYGSGTWTSDVGNVLQDPLFVNYAGNDFHLTANSPALATGANLTTATNSGSNSTSLIVSDPFYFQDGWGFPIGTGIGQMLQDCIAITTVGNHVCITAINYSTSTITLASSMTWASGDKIWLYSDSRGIVRLTGTAPNMGALGTVGGSPTVSLSPTSLSFGNEVLTGTSGSQTITLTNTGTAILNISSILITGTNSGDFSIGSNTCGSTLAVSSSCTVSVVFAPTATGARTASLTFTTNAGTSPDNTSLSGTGVIGIPASIVGTSKISGAIKIQH